MAEMQNTEIKSANPLTQYFRQPKIWIKLPSGGKFYPNNALDHSANDEYPVFAMTAKDELLFKTPDALLSGQSTVEVIKSCIPAIREPWMMPNSSASVCSRSGVPGKSWPERIRRRRCDATCSCRLEASFIRVERASRGGGERNPVSGSLIVDK